MDTFCLQKNKKVCYKFFHLISYQFSYQRRPYHTWPFVLAPSCRPPHCRFYQRTSTSWWPDYTAPSRSGPLPYTGACRRPKVGVLWRWWPTPSAGVSSGRDRVWLPRKKKEEFSLGVYSNFLFLILLFKLKQSHHSPAPR